MAQVIGSPGNDTLTGTPGADIFVLSGGNDVITDFNPGQGDRIQVPRSPTMQLLGSTNAVFTQTGGNGNNIVLTHAGGTLTLTGPVIQNALKSFDESWFISAPSGSPQGPQGRQPSQGQQSPNGTTVTSTSGQIVDGKGNVWSINNSGQVLQNGNPAGSTAGVTELALVNGAIWQQAHAGGTGPLGWWQWTGTDWGPEQTTSPLSTLTTGDGQVTGGKTPSLNVLTPQDYIAADWIASKGATTQEELTGYIGSAALQDPNLKNWTPFLVRSNSGSGMYGIAFKIGDGPNAQIVIAFQAGANAAQVNADKDLAEGHIPQADKDAATFVDDVVQRAKPDGIPANQIFVTGHSIAGAEAEYAYWQEYKQQRVTLGGGVTFGAPGIPGYAAGSAPPNLIDYVNVGDPVGNFASDTQSAEPGVAPQSGWDHVGTVKPLGKQSDSDAVKLSKTSAYLVASGIPANVKSAGVVPGVIMVLGEVGLKGDEAVLKGLQGQPVQAFMQTFSAFMQTFSAGIGVANTADLWNTVHTLGHWLKLNK